MVRLSTLRTGRLYPPEIFLALISVKDLSRPQGHSAAGRIMSMKNSSDTIGNRTRDLPACSAVPHPTALPRTPYIKLFLLPYGQYISDQSPFKSHMFRLPKIHYNSQNEGRHRLQVATSSVHKKCTSSVTLIKIAFHFKVHQHIKFATYTE